MRRKARRAVINLALFLCALLFIIYLNQPGRHHITSGIFAWTTIRYQPSFPSNHPALRICPGLSTTTKPALVISRISSDDTSWAAPLTDKYHICTYTADAPVSATPAGPRIPANRGHAAMPYLTFIIDNYAAIPAAGAVFIHGSRFAWHNDHPTYDNLDLLATLNVSEAIATQGYHNMRCDWSAGTCGGHILPQASMENKMQAKLSPWESCTVADSLIPGAFATLFAGEADASNHDNVLLGRDETLRAQCCAQFAVSRESILQHSREEYIALRQWLLDDAPRDDKVAGRILSYLWHVLFINHELSMTRHDGVELAMLNKLACPYAGDCYCRLYGKCDLQCPSAGMCRGMYEIPRDYKLPEDWGERFG